MTDTSLKPEPGTPALSLVVPTYNERRNIELLLDELHEVFVSAGIEAEVIVVDDGSPDGTGAYVEERSQSDSWVRVVRRAGKLGLTSAVMAGFEVARAPVLGVMDADLSHPPEAVPRLVAAIESGADFAIGSRYVREGGIDGWPFTRRFVSRTACLLAAPFTTVRDPMSGFFVIRRACIEGVHLEAKGFKIVLDLIMKASYRSVTEVPIVFTDRRYGESKISRTEVLNLLRSLGRYALAGQSARRRHD